MTYADQIFKENCREIIDHGCWDKDGEVRPRWEDGSPAYTIKRFGIINRYDLSAEFPILTLRKINFSAALDEIFWIWQKKSSNIADLGSHIWDSWADENGSIGKAYGYQLGVKHQFPEGEMDQVDMLLYSLHNTCTMHRIYNFISHGKHWRPSLYKMPAFALILFYCNTKE